MSVERRETGGDQGNAAQDHLPLLRQWTLQHRIIGKQNGHARDFSFWLAFAGMTLIGTAWIWG
jgi:hypothetical protein